jgi:hypothetical protein
MENLSGCLTAKLAQGKENCEKDLIEEINSRIKPPRPIGPADIYIRAMYIVSDQINSQGGCFAEEELEHLAELLVDSPVLAGHQRHSLPLARNFMASRVEIDRRPWVKSYFYWMKESEGAEDLRNNIDGGIYKECSISFLFALPECSICGRDIRECRHVPFREYEVGSGRQEIAHFKYRNIEKVLETSLVFRGAIPDTRITDELATIDEYGSNHESIAATHFFKLSEASNPSRETNNYNNAPISFEDVRHFIPDKTAVNLHLSPYQPGLGLAITKNINDIELKSTLPLPSKIRQYLTNMVSENLPGSFAIDALLYAVKGKQRLNGIGLIQNFKSGRSLHRLRLKVADIIELNEDKIITRPYPERLRLWAATFDDSETTNIELRKVRTCAGKEWNPDAIIQECTRYNYGIEAVAEDSRGLLTRHIMTNGKLMPAVIHEVKKNGRGQVICGMKTIGKGRNISGITCPGDLGVDQGTIVLVRRQPNTGGRHRYTWSLSDILPGDEKGRIQLSDDHHPDSADSMYIIPDRDRTDLILSFDNHWHRVTIHHFSAHLFRRGRRFIADIYPCDEPFGICNSGNELPLKSVVRAGKMVLICPAQISSPFGEVSRIWLRPILIDGVERFLFYSDEATGLPAGE